jgi:hypothetical protein
MPLGMSGAQPGRISWHPSEPAAFGVDFDGEVYQKTITTPMSGCA